jgi:eukaryotic-like serine/threonine-protein kinase
MESSHRHGPEIGAFSGHELIGEGGCGAVFAVEDAQGGRFALKIFNEKAIHRGLLEAMTRRLQDGGWPEGVIPAVSADFLAASAYRVMPLMADRQLDGTLVPRSLQHRIQGHPGLDSWKLVKALARALAGMHGRRVVHGNLKPGNVFFTENGDVQLTDWALGQMPGIQQFEFTDAVLYQAPEQLRDPGAYADEAGYRWDVFAFGVLAYRLLTGRFPRCQDTFSQVAPPQGETRREGLRADLNRIAQNLEAVPAIVWQDEGRGTLETQLREWITRCLELDPAKRPRDMVEVANGFAGVEKELPVVEAGDALPGRSQTMKRQTFRAGFALAAAALALVFAGLWHHTNTGFKAEKLKRADERLALKAMAATSLKAQATAETRALEAEQALDYEREVWLSRLQASRQTGDRLFAWAMEKGHRRLPPLDGHELRLKRLERYFEDFLTGTAEDPDLVEERARIRLQLAEISLAAGDPEKAATRLDDALRTWNDVPMTADLKFRVATDALLLALLRQSHADPETDAAFSSAREALAKVPRGDVDAGRLDQLLAALDFHEAKLIAARGDDTKALEQLMRATQTLNQLSEQRPDSAMVRSELAASYLSSATILDGIGKLGDAREVRTLAAAELVKLTRDHPGDPAFQLELAGCYGAMAESALLSGDATVADSMSRDALKLLDQVLSLQPDHPQAASRKAAQLGLRAGILRDRGETKEAMKLFDDGIRMLESIRASSPGDAMATYRLALLWWQKGRLSGNTGLRVDEIAQLGRARDLLAGLETSTPVSGPMPEQLQRTGAYVAGDLGHALQLANRKGDAARIFEAAVSLWQGLLKFRPENEEYQEGLSWSRQRLEDLK